MPVRFSRYELRPDFEHVRQIVNAKIYASLKDLDNITYWHHRRLTEEKCFAKDGVHMSAVGMPRYVGSMRLAAIRALRAVNERLQ